MYLKTAAAIKASDAYKKALAAHANEGGYVISPFMAWSRDDMAWEAAMDDTGLGKDRPTGDNPQASLEF
jgi:hypothetical protein